MSSFLTELRGAKPSLTSGAAWLVAAWLWFGDRLIQAFGEDCGAIAARACREQQSPAIHRIADLIDFIGPAGRGITLAVTSLLVGGTMNFLLGVVLRKPFPNFLHDIMEWSSDEEVRAHEEFPAEWASAVQVRGEAMARLAAIPPALFIVAFLAANVSWWWTLLIGPLGVVFWHGYAAMWRFNSHVKAFRERVNTEHNRD